MNTKFALTHTRTSTDRLLSSVSHFNRALISGVMRAGHEECNQVWRGCFINVCCTKVSDAALLEGFFAGCFLLVSGPFAGEPRPSFLQNTSSQSHLSLCLRLAQHVQPGLQIPISTRCPKSESSAILSTEQERTAGCGFEETRRVCHTRSGLLSLFSLRLGNSFRFNRISCREREYGHN